jgi:hypothetical protein
MKRNETLVKFQRVDVKLKMSHVTRLVTEKE